MLVIFRFNLGEFVQFSKGLLQLIDNIGLFFR